MAVYTVPANYTAYILKVTMSAQAGADATGNIFVRFHGQDTFRIFHTLEVVGSGAAYVYEFAIPNPVTEKSDIDIRASVRSNNGRYTAAWYMVLIKNEAS